ncbi:MAG: molybdenum cofactor biosynthesis protein MoaE [Terracidiphilus sp.]
MRVRVLAFGMLKDSLGGAERAVELPEGATVGDLLDRMQAADGAPLLRGIAVSVNAEYARAGEILHEGDEVGLLPPVSGGSGAAASETTSDEAGETRLTREAIDAAALVRAAKAGEDGAVVVFDGIVRNHSRGRRTLYLDYEAYEEMAARQMAQLSAEARARFGVRHVTIVHRLGRLDIGETSVLIVVAGAHRAQAYEASRWVIDTLKKTVPIWKRETFADGAVWANGEPFPGALGVEAGDAE